MSDQEDNTTENHSDENESSEPDYGGGACGGEGLRPSSPFSEGDNLSMEVHYGEGSSRHGSEVSSLSYQNLLDDTDVASGPVLSRRESEDSIDSFIPDDMDFPRDDTEPCDPLETPTQDPSACYSQKISDRISIQMTDEQIKISTTENILEGVHSTQSIGSDIDRRSISSRGSNVSSKERSSPFSVPDSFRKHELVVTKRELSSQRSRSLPPNNDIGNVNKSETENKRNSLEIRNNIPVVGEVKNYEKDLNNLASVSQGAKPKIRKQSPGLACRIEDGNKSSSDKDLSALDKDGERATRIINELIQVSKATALAQSAQNKRDKQSLDNDNIQGLNSSNKLQSNTDQMTLINNELNAYLHKTTDVENEYEYVKYARIQEGDSYVGKRLAYSSSNGEADSAKENNLAVNGMDNVLLDSSREGTPERFSQRKALNVRNYQDQVEEDTLDEIPLNGPDNHNAEDGKPFTLSPENTECDSIEVESVTSEGDKSPVGMPIVEDGLSSSQTSDLEDNIPSQDPDTPSKILQRKQKSALEQELYSSEHNTPERPREMDAQAIMQDLKAKREALDMAIHDIKSAIQKSKGVSLEAPYREESVEAEPVWIKRETQNEPEVPSEVPSAPVLKEQEILERRRENELAIREHEKVYELEQEKDRLLEGQYTRNNGKLYQTPKGYDSDDEYEDIDNVQYSRRVRGKKYASLPKDESLDSDSHRNYDGSLEIGNRRVCDSVSMYGDSNSYMYAQNSRNNSESQCSSEDFGSDGEVPSKMTYIHKRREGEFDTDEETDQLLEKQYQGNQYVDIPELSQPPVNRSAQAEKRQSRAKEVSVNDPDNPSVLIEGVLFRARYLGSTQLISEGQPSKAMRMMQAQEAVGRIKAPEGESQPSTEVDLFVSTEKIMVLNTDLQEIMMDHALRTISYIADIGDILVIMARRRLIGSPGETDSMRRRKQAKILCHVFETEEAQLIAQSIGQAFQVAYIEFLKANGIEDPGLMKEIDYQDVLNQQEIYGEELNLFANKEMHKEVIVPKLKGEHLGVVIVESGWGSMVPTVVLANMAPTGPAARCGQLNIGDQIISVNGISLVGLPLSNCQNYIKGSKQQTVVKLTVVPCPPVVEVLIKRPDVKYQLGFSVQNGVICSLLRGGIAERGGVRVGHRIIEINNQSVVAVPHEKIVSLLANSVGEIHMKTMPTSIFRLLTGQETPHYL